MRTRDLILSLVAASAAMIVAIAFIARVLGLSGRTLSRTPPRSRAPIVDVWSSGACAGASREQLVSAGAILATSIGAEGLLLVWANRRGRSLLPA